MRELARFPACVLRSEWCALLFVGGVAGCAPTVCPVGFVLQADRCVAVVADGGGTSEPCDGVDQDGDDVDDASDPDAHAACALELPPNVIARCAASGCTSDGCQSTHLDCSDAPGCETEMPSLEHCGECDRRCAWECGGAQCDDAVQVSIGWHYACALRRSGRVVCWGNNADGRLGDGTTEDRSRPVEVVGLTDVAEISTGEHHACARTSQGEIYCWGRNERYQLGTKEVGSFSATPVRVLSSSLDIVDIECGGFFTCARTGAGRVLCWGEDFDGVVGNGEESIEHVAEPNDVGLEDITTLAVGTWHVCALRESGSVVCWGQNMWGQLGDGSRISRHSVPESDVSGLVASAISAGNDHTCAIRTNGRVACWGGNDHGQLGDGSRSERTTVGADLPLEGIVDLDLGHQFSCARDARGGIYCWGVNRLGVLGVRSTTDATVPPSTPLRIGVAVELAADSEHACARLESGDVVCWGANASGQLGRETISVFEDMPAPVARPVP